MQAMVAKAQVIGPLLMDYLSVWRISSKSSETTNLKAVSLSKWIAVIRAAGVISFLRWNDKDPQTSLRFVS